MAEDITSPHQIIKAASACIWRGNEILLVQRGNALGHGFWSLPGGKMETGETAIIAATRELLEETNVIAKLQHHVGDFELDGENIRYMIACFTGFHVSGEATAMTDAKAVAWVDWRRIGDLRLAPNIAAAVALAHKLTSL